MERIFEEDDDIASWEYEGTLIEDPFDTDDDDDVLHLGLIQRHATINQSNKKRQYIRCFGLVQILIFCILIFVMSVVFSDVFYGGLEMYHNITSMLDNSKTISIVGSNYNSNTVMHFSEIDLNKTYALDNDIEEYSSIKEFERIAILGERNIPSIFSIMVECFPGIEVTSSLARSGHWFQDSKMDNSNKTTLVIATFLNVYDWVNLMRKNPLNAPNHNDMDWPGFVVKPWIIDRPPNEQRLASMKLCQFNFSYLEVIPCRMQSQTNSNPVYELHHNGSGKPYESIIQLRADKIRNFVSTSDYENVFSFLQVRYEDLIEKDGLLKLLQEIESVTKISYECDTSKQRVGYPFNGKVEYDDDYYKWIDKNVDWGVERMIGYDIGLEITPFQTKDNQLVSSITSVTSPPSSLITPNPSLAPTERNSMFTTPLKETFPPTFIEKSSLKYPFFKSSMQEPSLLDVSEVDTIVLLSERNSGLDWLLPKVVECFPNQEVTTTLSRPSPWFQDESINQIPRQTLVVSLFINPYTWVNLMRLHPIYAPKHKLMDWFTFLNAVWTMESPTSNSNDFKGDECQFHFSFNEVKPCKMAVSLYDDHPVYEMKRDKSGKPYKSILDLRMDKIQNFLNVSNWDNVLHLIPYRYEELTDFGGLFNFLEKIRISTGLKSSCHPSDDSAPEPPGNDDIVPEFRQWMNTYANWEYEHIIGYKQNN